jgi:RNA polymerase sigma-70 factor (ECF subfamily)
VSDPRSDDELMERGAQGDEDAFGILAQRWERPVFAFLRLMLGSPEEAQDLTQETFLRMCLYASRYRPSGHFRSWLLRISGNLARSRLRRRKILRWVRFDPGIHDRAAGAGDPVTRLESQEHQAAVHLALGRLPDRQRQAVILRQFEGLAYREIAAAMGTTVPAVETLLFRAMMALRKDIARWETRL